MGLGLGLCCCGGCEDLLCHRAIFHRWYLPSWHVFLFKPESLETDSSCDWLEQEFILSYVSDFVYEGTAGGVSVQLEFNSPIYSTGHLSASFTPSGYREIATVTIQNGGDILAFTRDAETNRLVFDQDVSTVSCCVKFAYLGTMVAARIVNYPADATLMDYLVTMSGWDAAPAACAQLNGTRTSNFDLSITDPTISSYYGGGRWPVTGRFQKTVSSGNQQIIVSSMMKYDFGYFEDATLVYSDIEVFYVPPVDGYDKWSHGLFYIDRRAGDTSYSAGWEADITIDHDPFTAWVIADMYGPFNPVGDVNPPPSLCAAGTPTLDTFDEV